MELNVIDGIEYDSRRVLKLVTLTYQLSFVITISSRFSFYGQIFHFDLRFDTSLHNKRRDITVK